MNSLGQEEPEPKIEMIILWDMENSPMTNLPLNTTYYDGFVNFRLQLKQQFPKIKIAGIYGYGSKSVSDKARFECDRASVVLRDVTSHSKDAVDRAIVLDMFKFAHAKLPPSYIMLISGDGDFSYALKELGSLGYTTILANTEKNCAQTLPDFCDFIVSWNKLYAKPKVKGSTLWNEQEGKSLKLKHPIPRSLGKLVAKVFWDTTRCSIEMKLHKVAVEWIESLLEDKLGEDHDIYHYAYGPERRPEFVKSLKENGVNYITTTKKKEELLENLILADILSFSFTHPPPCNIVLISADKELAKALQFLTDYKYNVMVVVPAVGLHVDLENAGTLLDKWPPQF